MHTGFKNLDDYLAKYDKFIVSTHESPDADGIGAQLAFHELLKHLGKKTFILNSDKTPDTIQFIDIENEIHVLSEGFAIPDDIEDYAQFVLDTNDFDNIGSAYSLLKDKVKDIFIIDHHEGAQDKLESNFIRVEASSASEIIYEIQHYYNMPLTFKSAQALYTGILFDTGSFRYPKTSPLTYRIAAHCMELGANPFTIYQHLYESNTLASFELRSLILSTMEVLHDGKMIAMRLTPEMLQQTGASFVEGEPAINYPLTVAGVVASVLVKQDMEGPVKVSMRTKGDYNVAKIAMYNGGGGHKNAAGYKSKHTFDVTYKKAIANMKRFFQ